MDQNLFRKVEEILAHKPIGLFTDIDGTISPIAPTPEEAYVPPTIRQHLRTLHGHLDLVAVISGRAAADAVEFVGIPELVYSGNHGLELWENGQAELHREAGPFVSVIEAALDEAKPLLTIHGVRFDKKGPTASIHFRQTKDPVRADEMIRVALEPIAKKYDLKLHTGRMTWELRPHLAIGKGTIARELFKKHKLKAGIFFGDDLTDTDAMLAFRELRDSRQGQTLSVGVLDIDNPSETRPELKEAADVLVEGVSGVEKLLAHIVRTVTKSPTTR